MDFFKREAGRPGPHETSLVADRDVAIEDSLQDHCKVRCVTEGETGMGWDIGLEGGDTGLEEGGDRTGGSGHRTGGRGQMSGRE